jgi:hypothetical protein
VLSPSARRRLCALAALAAALSSSAGVQTTTGAQPRAAETAPAVAATGRPADERGEFAYHRAFAHGAYRIDVLVEAGEAPEAGRYEITVSRGEDLAARLGARRRGILEWSAVGDLDGDGAFEVLIGFREPAGARAARLTCYEWTDDLYLLPVELAAPAARQTRRYVGHDAYRIAEGRLLWEYPLFPDDDPDAVPTGKSKRFAYDFGKRRWSAD